MWRWACGLVVAVSAAVGVWSCAPVEAAEQSELQTRILAATVTLADRCAGVVVEGEQHVVTAAHCIQHGEQEVPLRFADGTKMSAIVLEVDRAADVAILALNEASPALGLPFATELPVPGAAGYFAGRFDRGGALQEVTVVRLGPCPSLPGVPAALFTSLRGLPGDSGAPVVDQSLRVVGLVHGGARCSIAAPTHEVPELLEAMNRGVGGSGPT